MPVSLAMLLTAGVLIACGVYLFLERTLTRVVLGFILTGNGVNLLFLVAAGVPGNPPFEGDGDPSAMTDPLPQAMVLTAIVITLGISALVMALAYRAWQLFGHDEVPDDVEDRRVLRRGRRTRVRAAQDAVRSGARRVGAEADASTEDPDPAAVHVPAAGALSESHRHGALVAAQDSAFDHPEQETDIPSDDSADPLGADLTSAQDAPVDHTESDDDEEVR